MYLPRLTAMLRRMVICLLVSLLKEGFHVSFVALALQMALVCTEDVPYLHVWRKVYQIYLVLKMVLA